MVFDTSLYPSGFEFILRLGSHRVVVFIQNWLMETDRILINTFRDESLPRLKERKHVGVSFCEFVVVFIVMTFITLSMYGQAHFQH